MRAARAWCAAILAALVLAGCSSAPASTSADGGFVSGDGTIVVVPPAERKPAPDIRGTTLDGKAFALSAHLGKVVALNVWASWCAPCRAEAPALSALSADLSGNGVEFVGLNTRDSTASALAFVDRFGIAYPSVVDRDGRLQLQFGESLPPQAIPSTVIVDRQGRVAARALGRVSESSLRGMIELLMNETP